MQQGSITPQEADPITTSTPAGNGADISSNQAYISVKSLWKAFGKDGERIFDAEHAGKDKASLQEDLDCVVALQDVSFDVGRGETFVVMGLSGSGKSTLVRCLIRLIEPTSGQIIIDGQDVLEFDEKELTGLRRNKIAMVFQHYGLLPHRSVLENAAYGLEIRGVDQATRYEKAAFMLEKVGLAGWEHASTHELSGGMQQRVGLARALTVDPEILLMDEPFSGLDPLIRRQMREELASLQAELQKTIVFITHDLEEAITIGDRIAIMRDGKIIQLGSPREIIASPADEFVKEFTQGIPKTRVMDISSIISEPGVVCSESDSIDDLMMRMDRAKVDYAISLEQGSGYRGVISRARLDQLSESGVTQLENCLDRNVTPVRPETTLDDALPILANEEIPLPVVDESNNFIGVATQKDFLKVIASNI